nr:hypothetical protein CFP56_23504 [Quercus suber]
MDDKPRSRASLSALEATMTSTAVTKKGNGNTSAMEATTLPFQSQIMTPTPACFSSRKIEPSKLSLRFGQGGSFHLMFRRSLVVLSGGFGGVARRWAVLVNRASCIICWTGNSRELVRMIFPRDQTIQIMEAKRAKSAPTSMLCSTTSLKLMTCKVDRKLHSESWFHICDNNGQDHRYMYIPSQQATSLQTGTFFLELLGLGFRVKSIEGSGQRCCNSDGAPRILQT